ncbi:hypothetical protein A7A08_01545 [Methyloligella halotolerans]|uniref:L,D-transpeptidase scaffold domain-containing protein n=1 Tax=Methyloligella halotolerans TaxID=1177755 RepID=A0A1E2RZC7_9HYPH|nr:hypothetical protein [Methyloligella halotolerans]ODA67512.1 hypothetical protein A7A08_01545 [Methyloligella halotolerans]
MRPIYSIAVGLSLLAPIAAASSLPAFAAEPDGPSALIGRDEAIRISIQEQLSESFTSATETRKQEHGALVEFYSLPENKPLWVSEKGLTDRAKKVIAELQKADSYGLRSADYAVPDLSDFDPASFKQDPAAASKRLADAEIQISFAVARYAHDARGGRIVPRQVSGYLDPDLRLPEPLEVIESISFRSDPAGYLRSFQPDQPQFEALRRVWRSCAVGTRRKKSPRSSFRPARPFVLASSTLRFACSASVLRSAPRPRNTAMEALAAIPSCSTRTSRMRSWPSSRPTALQPTVSSAPAPAACSMAVRPRWAIKIRSS